MSPSAFDSPSATPTSFHLLVKPTGAICNLACEYCFYLSKEALYPGSRFRMDEDVLRVYLKQLLESHATGDVAVAWQGGEALLMGLDFFKRSIEYVEHFRRPHQNVQYTIQTNGTLLNDDWCAFFKEHHFLVGISIDGPREMHDRYRMNKGGRGTFDQVMHGLACLKKHNVEFNVLCTVNAANQDYPLDVYRFFRDDLAASFIQFIPVIERATEATHASLHQNRKQHDNPRPRHHDLVTERSVRPQEFGMFLSAIFDEWVRRDVGKVYVQHFDEALANWVGVPSNVCVFSETCGRALALEHNGDLYSCDHYVGPAHFLGNIRVTHMRQLVASEQQTQFGQDKLKTLPRYCLQCDVRFACHGGCPKNRFVNAPDGEPGLNYLCPGYKYFFHHVQFAMRIMSELLKRGRAPAEIMTLVSREDENWRRIFARTNRNAPCPCGSGLKFKQCHARPGVRPPLMPAPGS